MVIRHLIWKRSCKKSLISVQDFLEISLRSVWNMEKPQVSTANRCLHLFPVPPVNEQLSPHFYNMKALLKVSISLSHSSPDVPRVDQMRPCSH